TLKEISFYTPGQHYKADVKPEEGCVWIRAMVSDHGIQRTSSAAKAKLDILADAMTMPHETYRERLERFLRQNGFEIGTGTGRPPDLEPGHKPGFYLRLHAASQPRQFTHGKQVAGNASQS